MEEIINYRGYTIEIKHDDMCQNPNDMGDTGLTFLVYDHNSFCINIDGCDPQDVLNAMQEGHKTFSYKSNYMDKYAQYKFFPVFAYIHSGVSLSLAKDQYPFNDQWDLSFKGFCMVNTNEFPDEKRQRKVAEATIDEWNHYLSSNTWGYDIDELNESCWGFVGDTDYVIEEAKSVVDAHLKNKLKKHLGQLKAYIRNRVPFMYRKPATS